MRPLLADATSTAILVGVVAVVAYFALLWVALAFYVVRDARRRSQSISFLALAMLLGFVPPYLGPLVYLVVRPPLTLEEERALAIEERALLEPLQTEEPSRPCPSCGRDIENDFVICPYCRTQFARRCASCDRLLRLGWNVCPYCAEEVGSQPQGRRSATS